MTGNSNRWTPPAASTTMERLKRKTDMLMWTKRVEYFDWALNESAVRTDERRFHRQGTIEIKIEAL